jgi:hypothetical protein
MGDPEQQKGENAPAATADQAAKPATPPPVVPTVGRVVLYVLPVTARRAGEIRPADVVRVNEPGNPDSTLNLGVKLDGPNDDVQPGGSNTGWVGSVHHDQDTKAPGTWHWMDYQKGQAAKVDVIATEVLPKLGALADIMAKIQSHLEDIGEEIDAVKEDVELLKARPVGVPTGKPPQQHQDV